MVSTYAWLAQFALVRFHLDSALKNTSTPTKHGPCLLETAAYLDCLRHSILPCGSLERERTGTQAWLSKTGTCDVRCHSDAAMSGPVMEEKEVAVLHPSPPPLIRDADKV